MKDRPPENGTERNSPRPHWRSVSCLLPVLLLLACSSASLAVEVLRAELGAESATTGEAVPLIITLYSPGPFSGTATFDLPEAPRTVIVKIGNPVVGSEQIDDQSFFTQRHEFAIFSQESGEIVIPAFSVRFSGKKTFTSAPEAIEGFTPELRFRSTRPPGTEQLGTVIAARNMKVEQTWKPDSNEPVDAGEVITRTISRRATGAMAMMFPPVPIQGPDSVRSYSSDPIVQDFTERGEIRAERKETIKYQFERPGTFFLPDVTVTWWDPDAKALMRETLPGMSVSVRDAIVDAEPAAPASRRSWPLLLLLAPIGVVAWWIGRRAVQRLAARRNAPANAAARRVFAACRTNSADEAYAALLQWRRSVNESSGEARLGDLLNPDTAAALEDEWNSLSRHVYGVATNSLSWNGQRLAHVFARVRRTRRRNSGATGAEVGLPSLNPTSEGVGDLTSRHDHGS